MIMTMYALLLLPQSLDKALAARKLQVETRQRKTGSADAVVALLAERNHEVRIDHARFDPLLLAADGALQSRLRVVIGGLRDEYLIRELGSSANLREACAAPRRSSREASEVPLRQRSTPCLVWRRSTRGQAQADSGQGLQLPQGCAPGATSGPAHLAAART